MLTFALLPLQRKRVKRRKSHGKKKEAAPETSPEALEETWKIVEEELKGAGFKVGVKLSLEMFVWLCRNMKLESYKIIYHYLETYRPDW